MSHAHVLAPSLIAGSIIHLSFPADSPRVSSLHGSANGNNKAKGKGREAAKSAEPVVRELPIRLAEDEAAAEGRTEVDVVKRIARSGEGRSGKLVLADANYVLSVCDLPRFNEQSGEEADEEDEQDHDGSLVVQHQFALRRPAKAGTTWTGLEAGENGVLSTLSSGLLRYNAYDGTPARHRLLPTGLLAMRGISLSSSADTGGLPHTLALAGKSFEVSLWDTERTLAAGSEEEPVRDKSSRVAGQKRKIGNKKEMEEGEVWRARNMPNNHLDLPTAIHHTCLTVLPASSTAGTAPQLVTGTLSGHVRIYDTRQRKAVREWKVAREGGMGCVEAGRNEHELFFSDRSSMLGALDLRTGKILYTYSAQTSTPLSLLPLPLANDVRPSTGGVPHLPLGLATVSSDATLRLCSTSGVPDEGKGNVRRGEIVRAVGGVGLGSACWLGWGEGAAGEDEADDDVEVEKGDEDEEGDSEDEAEDLFDQMGVVQAGDEEDDSSNEETPQGRQEPAKKRRAV